VKHSLTDKESCGPQHMSLIIRCCVKHCSYWCFVELLGFRDKRIVPASLSPLLHRIQKAWVGPRIWLWQIKAVSRCLLTFPLEHSDVPGLALAVCSQN